MERKITRKADAYKILRAAEQRLAEHRGLPYDELAGERYGSSSDTIAVILARAKKVDAMAQGELPQATEKQLAYLRKLIARGVDGDKEIEKWNCVRLNKYQASFLISSWQSFWNSIRYLSVADCNDFDKDEDVVYEYARQRMAVG